MRARSVVVAVALVLYGACASTSVDAAVGCRNKKGVPVVRDDACKKKEAAVDLTQFVATTTTVASTTTSSSATSSSPATRSVPTLVRAI